MEPPSGRDVFLSIIVPAYDEAARIDDSLERILAFLGEQAFTWEVVVVDDGSRDATAAIVRARSKDEPRIRLIEIDHAGKGAAVRAGMLAASGEYRCLSDADLSTPIEEVLRFIPPHLTYVDIAIGSREVDGARRFGEPVYRHVMGRIFNYVVRALAVRGIRDTQCGFKCFRRDAAEQLFSRQRLDGFGFDVEVLFLARRAGLRMIEIPIPWTHRAGSKVRAVRDSIRMFSDVVRVRWNVMRRRYLPVRDVVLQPHDASPPMQGSVAKAAENAPAESVARAPEEPIQNK